MWWLCYPSSTLFHFQLAPFSWCASFLQDNMSTVPGPRGRKAFFLMLLEKSQDQFWLHRLGSCAHQPNTAASRKKCALWPGLDHIQSWFSKENEYVLLPKKGEWTPWGQNSRHPQFPMLLQSWSPGCDWCNLIGRSLGAVIVICGTPHSWTP